MHGKKFIKYNYFKVISKLNSTFKLDLFEIKFK